MPIRATTLLPLIFVATPAKATSTVSVLPFVWAPSLEGTLEFGPLKIPLHVSPTQLADGARAGAMIYAERNGGGITLFGQLLAAKFSDNRFAPLSGLHVAAELISVEAGIGKPLAWQRVTVTPFVAGRYSYLAGSLSGAPSSLRASRNWNELLVGVTGKHQLGERLDVQVRYTNAILSPTHDSNWDIIAASTYRLGPHVAAVGGYRWSQQRVDQTGGNPFGFRLTAKGPILGIRLF